MQLLPRRGILAIAAVIDIALQARSGPVAAKALASRHRLPPRHLEPVLQALVSHGILKSVRGPRGGYELAREWSRITADEILRAAGTVDDIESQADRPIEAAQLGGDAGAFGGRAGVRGCAVAHQYRGTGALSRGGEEVGQRAMIQAAERRGVPRLLGNGFPRTRGVPVRPLAPPLTRAQKPPPPEASRGRSGGVVNRHFDDLDAVLEFDALDDFRQLVFAI